MRLLDLGCGAGGCSVGYHEAGFEVVGVDIEPQPNYPFRFEQGDMLTFPLGGFDAIHVSPPCQAYSRMRHLPWLKDKAYPRLIEPMLVRFEGLSVPWVLENVMDARPVLPMAPWLCGVMFDLPLYRHRLFANNWRLIPPPHRKHRFTIVNGNYLGARARLGHVALGLDWMTTQEQSQAIHPAYTRYIGERLMEVLAK